MQMGPKSNFIAIYENVCLINHSCKPNVSWNYVKEFESQIVFAVKDISKGEELLVNYVGE